MLADARPYALTPNGESLWRWIGWAFVAYWALFASSAFTGQRELNTVGGLFILAVLAWGVLGRLWVKVDGVVLASLAAMLIPLVHVFAGDAVQSSEAIFKHESLCAVMAMSRLLRLPVASSSKLRWVLALPVLLILVISIAVDRGAAGDVTRRAGLFVNPNNLALIPFLLLFLIDELRDPLAVRLGVHAIVIAVLMFSGTSGAVIAYAIGLAVHMRARLSTAWRLLALPLVLVAGSGAVALMLVDGDNLLPETRLTKQLSLMRTEFQNVLQGGQVAYYDQERMLGTGATSAVWRLAHWRRTIGTYLDGTPAQQLFGFGIGSSPVLLGKLPHNEYLRVLFEQGIAGLLLFLFAWRRILMTAPPSVRYVGLIVAIYSFSENNLDNFPFMSLFILFLSATELVARRDSVRDPLRQCDRPVVRFRQQTELCPSRSAQ
jgi:hypothetical protein